MNLIKNQKLISIFILGLLLCSNFAFSQTWVQKGAPIYGLDTNAIDGFSVSVDSDGTTIAIGAPQYGGSPGYARVFEWSGSAWLQKGATLSAGVSFDWFGHDVKISGDGNTLAIGIPQLNNTIRVYEWNGLNWIQKGNDIFAHCRSIDMTSDGQMIVSRVAVSGSSAGQDKIQVFQYDGFTNYWNQIGNDIIGEEVGEATGFNAVGINDLGTSIIYGAPLNSANSTNAGSARVYNAGGWTGWYQSGNDLDGLNSGDEYGTGVSINASGNIIAVSAWNSFPNHYTKVFEYNFTTSDWLQKGGDLLVGRGEEIELDASGDRIIINGENLFNAVVYDWNGTSWNQFGQLIPTENVGDQARAISMSNDGTTIAVGVHEDDSFALDAGYTRIYSLCYESQTTIDTSVCYSYTIPSGDETYSISGVYSDTLINSGGCDSLITINLTVGNTSFGTDSQSACNSYTWIDGNTYTASTNIPTWTLTNALGCDSIITLDLTMNYSNSGIDSQTACDSYTWIDGNTYTVSTNTPTWTLTNALGCDSLVTLNLTINAIDVSVTQIDNSTLQANTSAVQYQWLYCDSAFAIIQGETDQTFIATQNGSFAVQIIQNGCVDTSACIPITHVGLIENDFGNSFVAFPNPTQGFITVSLGSIHESVGIRVLNLQGKVISNQLYKQQSTFGVYIYDEAGIYFLEISSKEKYAKVKIIKH